jgi:hypothetical protein
MVSYGMDSEFREVGEPDEMLRSALLYQLEHADFSTLIITGVRTSCAELALLLRPAPQSPPERPAPSPMAIPSSARLTAGEMALIRKLGECWNDLQHLESEPPMFNNRREALALIHQLQLLVMSRMAQRVHPEVFW